MEAVQRIESDLIHDDMNAIESLKDDLIGLVKRIERIAENGTLKSIDRAMLATQCMAMEMCLDDILSPDWRRLSNEIGIVQPIPRSPGYLEWLARPPLRVPTNPATYEMAGAQL